MEPDRPAVVVLTSTLPRWPGDGTPGFVLEFAQRMQARGFAVTVVAPHHAGARTRETLDGVPVRRFRYWLTARGETIAYDGGALGKMRRSPLYALKLGCFLAAAWCAAVRAGRDTKAAVVNAHWLLPQGFLAVAARPFTRARVVVTIHGGDVFSLNARLLKRAKSWTLRRADAVVTNSSATRAAAAALWPGRAYPVIPMGIDTAAFTPFAAPPAPQTAGDFQILFVGRLAPEKGPAYLLQALSVIMRKRATNAPEGQPFVHDHGGRERGVHLTFVGAGPEESRLRTAVQRRSLTDHVTFAGWVAHEELPAYYAAADVLAAPSIVADNGWQEAFGLVFAEALACGTPVVGTRTGGIADIVTDGGTGLLVPQRDPEALAGALQRLMDDPDLAVAMGKRGREHVVANFSWDAVAQRYAEIFDRVGAKRR